MVATRDPAPHSRVSSQVVLYEVMRIAQYFRRMGFPPTSPVLGSCRLKRKARCSNNQSGKRNTHILMKTNSKRSDPGTAQQTGPLRIDTARAGVVSIGR